MRRIAFGRGWFAGAIALASFLLFCCEPMAAKELLPAFGGSAAVWLTCLVFFQAGVLAGYGYAHWLTREGGAWRRYVHLGLLVGAAGFAAGVGNGARGV